MPQWPFVRIENGWPTIEVGAMRHLVEIQRELPANPPAYDAAGPRLAWQKFVTAKAAIETVRGTDVIRSGQITTQLFLTVALWFQPGIASNMRLVSENGSTYLIQSVENILEMNIVLVLNCLALGANE